MNVILSLPLEIRLAVVFVLGACVGAAANWAIYALAWHPRPISPWSRPDPSAPPRRLWDRLPILGWLGLRREAALHGGGFWVRPMLVEVLDGRGPGLALLVGGRRRRACCRRVSRAMLGPGLQTVLHFEFAAHCLLIALMLAGSLIDVDEKIIPDEITVPARWSGCCWRPCALGRFCRTRRCSDPASCTSPRPTTGRRGSMAGLGPDRWPLPWAAGGCGAVAILPRSWYRRHGWLRAVQLSCAG